MLGHRLWPSSFFYISGRLCEWDRACADTDLAVTICTRGARLCLLRHLVLSVSIGFRLGCWGLEESPLTIFDCDEDDTALVEAAVVGWRHIVDALGAR